MLKFNVSNARLSNPLHLELAHSFLSTTHLQSNHLLLLTPSAHTRPVRVLSLHQVRTDVPNSDLSPIFCEDTDQ
jgi:hypothetical protein